MGPEWKMSAHERPLVACVCVCCFWWQRSSTGAHRPLKVVGAQVFSAAFTCPAVQPQDCLLLQQITSGSSGLQLPTHVQDPQIASIPHQGFHLFRKQRRTALPIMSKLLFFRFAGENDDFLSGSVGSFRSQDLCNTERTLVSADLPSSVFLDPCRAAEEPASPSLSSDAAAEPTEWTRSCSQPLPEPHPTHDEQGRSPAQPGPNR